MNSEIERSDSTRPTARRIAETQSCARGEHRYVTGRRTCPHCGAEL